MEAIVVLVLAALAFAGFKLLTRQRDQPTPHTSAPSQPGRPAPQGGISLDITYTDGSGTLTARRITITDMRPDHMSETPFALSLEAWCHLRQGQRTFLTNRITQAADGETGEIIPIEGLPLWLHMKDGRTPFSPRPEAPPGRISIRRPHPPLAVTVDWERTPGDLETFDVEISEVELAAGVPFAFTGRARRRKSETDRAWTGQRRFKLRLSADGDAPVRTFWPKGEDAPHPAPHRWLENQTRR